MSKVVERLKADVEKRFGPGADAVIEYLYDFGTIHDMSARNHMVKVDAIELMMREERMSERQVYLHVSDEYGCSDIHVRALTNR